MPYKGRRATNVKKLIDSGFLPFEAREMTRTTRTTDAGKRIRIKPLPFNTPYIKDMIKQRKAVMKQAQRDKSTQKEYRKRINKFYDEQGFVRPTTGRRDVWQLIRLFEEKFKETHPEFESPGGKTKRKKPVDMRKKFLDSLDAPHRR